MSHEIRTPMNGVMGMTEILSCADLTQDQRRHLRTIRESSVSLLAIIEDILDMSRIEAGKLELNLEAHDLYDVLDGSADSLRSEADHCLMMGMDDYLSKPLSVVDLARVIDQFF